MEVHRHDDPAAFAAEVGPYLLRAAARHNLMLGILDLLQRRPEVYPTFHLWSVTDGEALTGVAMQTPPHNLVVAEPARPAAIDALADAIVAAGIRLPGVIGALPEAEAFGAAWTARVGGVADVGTRQGIYALAAVRDSGEAAGSPRLATPDDQELLPAGTRTSSPRRSRTSSATRRLRRRRTQRRRSPTRASGSGRTPAGRSR